LSTRKSDVTDAMGSVTSSIVDDAEEDDTWRLVATMQQEPEKLASYEFRCADEESRATVEHGLATRMHEHIHVRIVSERETNKQILDGTTRSIFNTAASSLIVR